MANKFEYPCILEVSRHPDFIDIDPNLPATRHQVCIGEIEGTFMCLYRDRDYSKENLQQLLIFVKQSVKSGGVNFGTIWYWKYARKV